MRIGILGGSFNPPHYGHLGLAQAALATGWIEAVVFIPAAIPPHKETPAEADAPTRLAMTLLLAAGDQRLSVDGLELERAGPSYTIDTIKTLYAKRGSDSYRLVIGSDMALTFSMWKDYAEILLLAPPMVAERPDALLDETTAAAYPDLQPEERALMLAGRFPMPHVHINSALIRQRIAESAPRSELERYLPPSILDYIESRHLYNPRRHDPSARCIS